MKSAVIIVHGIGPLDRYQIQDQFAAELRDALNTETDDERRQRFGGDAPPRLGQWHSDVIWPPVARNEALEGVRPSAVRVHCDNYGKDVAAEPTVDVFEAYWSPVDKGQTNALGVLAWLLRSIFSPIASVRLAAPFAKTLYDVGFVVLVALLVPLLTIFALVAAWRAYVSFTSPALPAWVALLIGLAGAYLVAQGLSRLVPLLFLARRAGRSVRRPLFLVILGLAIVAATSWIGGGSYVDMFARAGWLVATATTARLLWSLLVDFLDSRIGDIQMYSTHNENARLYALREQILRLVGDVALSVMRTKEGVLPAPLYDRVYLVGHSLGSSILMDIVIELHRLMMEGGLDEGAWNRLRALVTVGGSLEKTHYLLSCARPMGTRQADEFKADLYSRLFTADPEAMRTNPARGQRSPMFWTNYWYFSDVVANAIASYGKARNFDGEPPEPGVHYTCLNVELKAPSGRVWAHSYYLDDRALWHSRDGYRGLATLVAST